MRCGCSGKIGWAPYADIGAPPGTRPSVEARRSLEPRKDGADPLEIDLLGHLQRVIDLDAKVSDRALELPVSK